MTSKIYVAAFRDYEEFRILGCYSTLGAAQEREMSYREENPKKPWQTWDIDIEEYTLDE